VGSVGGGSEEYRKLHWRYKKRRFRVAKPEAGILYDSKVVNGKEKGRKERIMNWQIKK
jgi:hypothetical protein